MCQQEQLHSTFKTSGLKISGGEGVKIKIPLSPLKDTERSAAHCRRKQNISKISYCCLEISTKTLGIHQTKMSAESDFSRGQEFSLTGARGYLNVLSRKMQI